MKINNLTPEDLEELEDAVDFFSFEKYCGPCEFFNDETECPFYGKVFETTEWAKIGCKKFFD